MSLLLPRNQYSHVRFLCCDVTVSAQRLLRCAVRLVRFINSCSWPHSTDPVNTVNSIRKPPWKCSFKESRIFCLPVCDDFDLWHQGKWWRSMVVVTSTDICIPITYHHDFLRGRFVSWSHMHVYVYYSTIIILVPPFVIV